MPPSPAPPSAPAPRDAERLADNAFILSLCVPRARPMRAFRGVDVPPDEGGTKLLRPPPPSPPQVFKVPSSRAGRPSLVVPSGEPRWEGCIRGCLVGARLKIAPGRCTGPARGLPRFAGAGRRGGGARGRGARLPAGPCHCPIPSRSLAWVQVGTRRVFWGLQSAAGRNALLARPAASSARSGVRGGGRGRGARLPAGPCHCPSPSRSLAWARVGARRVFGGLQSAASRNAWHARPAASSARRGRAGGGARPGRRRQPRSSLRHLTS